MLSTPKDYEIVAADKLSRQRSKIPEAWLIILSDVECEITSDYGATDLLGKLKDGVYSVELVIVAFCKRAAIAHQLANCLTEIFFDKAIERARELEAKRREPPNEAALSLLFGLPISLKDSFQVLGEGTSTGIGCYMNEPAEESSVLAALILDLGVSIMTGESYNNMFGRTVNPLNIRFTAGGSTSGDGALVELRGSILGVGTDIGGSVRVPSVCNGIYGFKPSVDRTVPGTTGVMSSASPMATSLCDCSLFLRMVKDRYRIGLIENDGMYTPLTSVRRGLEMAADRLRDQGGVEIIPLTLPDYKEYYLGPLDYFTISGPDVVWPHWGPLVPSLKGICLLDPLEKSLRGFVDLNIRRAEATKPYLKLFRDNNLDAILMPGAPHTAVPHDTWTTASFNGLWSYLDYPAIVIPVDKVREEDAIDDVSSAKFGEVDAKCYSLCKKNLPLWVHDLPICVQLVGYRHADQVLLDLASVVE
ncbi:putative fatty-acid amide hydrolase [Xylaria grammica]|nr:putative fatty-acid amide hydrolase [Xylaria grammica]